MHPLLEINDKHVQVLRLGGITSMEAVKNTLQQAVQLRRKKESLPEGLDKLAGLCQRALMNPGAFKTMIRLQMKDAQEHPAHHGGMVVG